MTQDAGIDAIRTLRERYPEGLPMQLAKRIYHTPESFPREDQSLVEAARAGQRSRSNIFSYIRWADTRRRGAQRFESTQANRP